MACLPFRNVRRLRMRIPGSGDLPKDRPHLAKVLFVGSSDLHTEVRIAMRIQPIDAGTGL
jgi:hypothetical protein